MSVNAFGVFIISSNTLESKIETSYIIQGIANNYKIGLIQGINLSIRSGHFLSKEYELNLKYLRYDITDNPLDCNAEYIFGGYDFDDNIDECDTLKYRMKKIQMFFKEVIETGLVNEIHLYINIEIGDQYAELNTTASDFSEKVIKVFKDEEGWTPSIKIIIKNL